MTFRVLADENVDQRVVHRLDHYGHDVEHVDFVSDLGKGASDDRIARYSLSEDRLILTSDEDFLVDFDTSEHRGLLFVEDETLTAAEIADIVHAVSDAIDQNQIEGIVYASRNWL